MFLPIGDTPNPPRFRAWVTWLLIAANVAVFVLLTLPLSATGVDPSDPRLAEYVAAIREELPSRVPIEQVLARMSQWDLFVFEYGFRPGSPEPLDLFVSMFLHGGIAHLLGNMLFLWIYGDNVEHRVGRLGFLLLYVLTGIAATLGFSVLAGDTELPMVGASGAISGVLGLYFLMFPRNQVKVFVFLFPLLMNVWLIPARLVLGLYVLIDNLLPLIVGMQSGVAHGAHLGGFFAGLGVAVVGERLDWRLPGTRRAPAVARADDVESVIREAHDLVRSGERVAAARLLRWSLDRAPRRDRARLHLALAEVLLEEGEVPAAYQQVVMTLEAQPDPVTARRARSLILRMPLDPRLLRRMGLGGDRGGQWPEWR